MAARGAESVRGALLGMGLFAIDFVKKIFNVDISVGYIVLCTGIVARLCRIISCSGLMPPALCAGQAVRHRVEVN